MNKKIFNSAKEKLKGLAIEWGKADIYLVGGCVRDLLLGNPVKDIDLCVDLKDGATLFCEWLQKTHIEECHGFTTFPRFGTSKFVLKVMTKELDIECVMPRVEAYKDGPRKPSEVKYTGITEDAYRRDFCCNALYQNIITDEILDPTGHGKEDIENRVLRTPLPAKETFIDDPLRMLRAFRFSAQKWFKILDEVLSEIRDYPEYRSLSMERVQDEFNKILMTNNAVSTIRELHRTGLLGYIIPELEESWGFNQNSHYHSMNLTDHTLAVLQGVIDNDANLQVRLAALLHDIAKYKCWKKKDNGEFSYHGHELESSKLATKILERLKYPKEDIQCISEIIKEHMRIKSLYNPNTDSYTGSTKTTRRVVRDLGPLLKSTLQLIDADNKAHAPQYNMPGQVNSFLAKLDSLSEVQIVRSCPVSGNLIMSEFGLTPGPAIKEIKDIFLDWLDEDPEIPAEELITRLKEITAGNYVCGWWESYRGFCISDNEPIKGRNGITPSPYQVPMELGDWVGLSKEITRYPAIQVPRVYFMYQKYKKAKEIFNRAATVLDELFDIPGFNGVKVSFDKYHDLSGEISWEDRRPDWII